MNTRYFAAAFALLSLSSVAFAGLEKQPKPAASAAAQMRSKARLILSDPNPGAARGDLIILVEKAATTDFTEAIAPGLGDETTYTSLVATLEDALSAAKTAEDKAFIRYNIARLGFLHGRLYRPGTARNTVLAAAAKAAEGLSADRPRDPGLWELTGDIEAERGDLEGAVAAYRRLNTADNYKGGRAAVSLRIGQAYLRGNRPAPALQAFQAGIPAAVSQGENGEVKHLLYQGIAAAAYQRNDFATALDALSRSAKATQSSSEPFRFRLNTARLLLERGYTREVQAYAKAAANFDTNDPDARALLDLTNRAPRRR